MAKILVVDDETDLEVLIKQKFRKKIRDQEYEFLFAINGKDALLKVSEHPDLDIVLSDINMPGMSGLDLLKHIKTGSIKPPPVVMMITAYGDEEILILRNV